jgi:hypothetical protein
MGGFSHCRAVVNQVPIRSSAHVILIGMDGELDGWEKRRRFTCEVA